MSYNDRRDRGPRDDPHLSRHGDRKRERDNSSYNRSGERSQEVVVKRARESNEREDRIRESGREHSHSSRDRDRNIKQETDTHRRDRRPRDDPHSDRSRHRDPKREKDWDNFFNPSSDMSQQAVVKRERDDNEREDRIREFGGDPSDSGGDKNIEKEKPNFGLSGKLTEETNTYRGVVIKYSEPPEARKPMKTRWRLYPFKDGEALEVMYIHRQSAYLLGRERKIADIPIDHPSCSKQHAVIQYRLVPYERPNGMKGRRIRPYVIDLESSNGTYVNGDRIAAKRYVELFEKDVLKFGFSSREYVLLHEHSKDDDPLDDDGYDQSPSSSPKPD